MSGSGVNQSGSKAGTCTSYFLTPRAVDQEKRIQVNLLIVNLLDHDAKVFALVVLISSLFIFNSMQTIDENAISALSLATQISSFIKLNSASTEHQLNLVAPKFLWLLRDFALELFENGRTITENEYLESRLSNFSR